MINPIHRITLIISAKSKSKKKGKEWKLETFASTPWNEDRSIIKKIQRITKKDIQDLIVKEEIGEQFGFTNDY